MDNARQFMERDKFVQLAGIRLLEQSPGHATAEFDVAPHHLNGAGTVHGGAIFTLADFAFAAANSHGTVALAVNASISYVKAVREGTLTAKAIELSLGPKLASYRVDITEDTGDIVALFQGMVYRKRDPIENVPH